MKNKLYLKKYYLSVLSLIILALGFSFSGCDEAGEILDDSLSGTYIMQKVTLTEDMKIEDIVILEAGSDVTIQAAGGIAGSAPCEDKTKTAIDLRSNNDLYLVCIGESNEEKAGTWEEDEGLTTLKLNLSSPPLPSNLILAVVDVVSSLAKITGKINSMPVDPTLFTDIIPPGTSLPPVFLLSVEVEFVAVVDL